MLISKFDLYKSEWLELVFEKRNKSYGAYELRQHHADNTLKALAITLFSFASIAVTLNIISHLKPAPIIERSVEVKLKDPRILLPPPPKKEVKPVSPAASKPLKATPAAPTVVIPTHVTPNPVVADPPTITQISTSAIGSEPSKGTGVAQNADPAPVTGAGTGTGTAPASPGQIYQFADVEPQPMGGLTGWAKFLHNNLRYPDTDTQGRVILSFVVELDGSVTDIKVVRSVSPEIDQEAIRVLKMAPKWTPGKQAGQPVRVQFNMPFNFQLNN